MDESTPTRSKKVNKNPKKSGSNRWWKVTKVIIIVFLVLTLLGGGIAAGYVATLIKETPNFNAQAFSNLAATTYIYDRNQVSLGSMQNDGRRELIKSIDEVSPNIVHAFVSAEDKNFYTHYGINPTALLRAAYQNFIGHGIVSGASTITQQTVKNVMFPDQEKTIKRKIQEMVLAIKMEQVMTKNEILVNYFNWIYFGKAGGDNIYGIEAASKAFFGKPASEINLAQASVLAALPNNPSKYNLFTNLDNAKVYQDYVLHRMLEDGYITQAQLNEAKSFDLQASLVKKKAVATGKYPWVVAEVEQRAAQKLFDTGKFDTLDDARQNLFRGGYKVYTTIDQKMQDIVDSTLANDSLFYPKAVTYKDKSGKTIENAQQQAGATLIDNASGAILAVGAGRHYADNQNNHTLLPRQPGSTMKPIAVYGPAIDKKLISAGSVIDDVPMALPNPSAPGGRYFPMNWNFQFQGHVTVRTALRWSYNIPAIKTFQMLTPKVGLDFVKKLGVSTIVPQDNNLIAAIGGLTEGISVEQLTAAYSVFPNMGEFKPAHLITKIVDRNGNTVYEDKPTVTRVFSDQTSYVMTDLMRDVVQHGTASGIGSHFGNYPIAGKTGTTDENSDAWFVGYTPSVTLGIWMGYDIPKEMANSEGSRPQTLWKAIMDKTIPLLASGPQSFPSKPAGVTTAEFCTISGDMPNELSKEMKWVGKDLFVSGTVPTKACDMLVKVKYVEINGKKYLADANTPASIVKEGIFFKRDPYELPFNNPKYKPLDSEYELPKEFESTTKPDVTPSNGPTGLKVISTQANQITIGWDTMPNVEGYVVLRAVSQAGPFQIISSIQKETQFSDSKVVAGTEYYYQVMAVDKNGIQSGSGSIINATAGSATLAAPEGVKARSSLLGVDISWNAVPSATLYVIYRSDNGASFQPIDSTNQTSYTDMSASASGSYRYQITAKNSKQESAPSAPVTVESTASGSNPNPPTPPPSSLTKPATPQAPSAIFVAADNAIDISWDASAEASEYILERRIDQGSWTVLATQNSTTYQETRIKKGKKYYYRLRIVSSSGQQSDPSPEAVVSVP